jgi:tetratricopeptide (TPR) repeat protein
MGSKTHIKETIQYVQADEYKKALSTLSKLAEIVKIGSKLDKKLKQIIFSINQLQETIDAYDLAKKHYSDSSINFEKISASCYEKKGLVFLSLNEKQKANSYITKAIQMYPQDPSYYFNRALTYNLIALRMLKQLEPAKADLEKALSLDPSYKLAKDKLKIVNEFFEFQERDEKNDRRDAPVKANIDKDKYGLEVKARETASEVVLLIKNAKLNEAKDKTNQLIKNIEEIYGKNSLKLGIHLLHLAIIHSKIGELEFSKSYLDRYLSISKEMKEDGNPIESTKALIDLYYSLGDFDKAEQYAQELLEFYQSHESDDKTSIASIEHLLAQIYLSDKKYEKAEPLLLDASKTQKDLLGEEDCDLALTFSDLGLLYKETGKLELSKNFLIQARDIQDICYGKNHPSI